MHAHPKPPSRSPLGLCAFVTLAIHNVRPLPSPLRSSLRRGEPPCGRVLDQSITRINILPPRIRNLYLYSCSVINVMVGLAAVRAQLLVLIGVAAGVTTPSPCTLSRPNLELRRRITRFRSVVSMYLGKKNLTVRVDSAILVRMFWLRMTDDENGSWRIRESFPYAVVSLEVITRMNTNSWAPLGYLSLG